MPNQMITLPQEILVLLRQEENMSGLIADLLREHYKPSKKKDLKDCDAQGLIEFVTAEHLEEEEKEKKQKYLDEYAKRRRAEMEEIKRKRELENNA